MSQPKLDMWDEILKTYSKVLSDGENAYLSKAKGESPERGIVVEIMRRIQWYRGGERIRIGGSPSKNMASFTAQVGRADLRRYHAEYPPDDF